MQTIGVGITTRNRVDVLEQTVMQFNKHYGENIRYVVVDDNSDDPELNQTWAEVIGDYQYNKKRIGVAKSKNECIKALYGVDHMFLFDDDCIPIKDNWWLPWINSGVHHMTYACEPNIKPKLKTTSLVFWHGGFGCCLYFSKKCIDTVGGFDPRFGMWGFEHSEITTRIFKSGIISHPTICPKDPGVWSFDAQGSYKHIEWLQKSSVTEKDKVGFIRENSEVLRKALAENNTHVDIWR